MRKKVMRVLAVPFVLLGLLWFHVERAFKYGYEWEKDQMQ